MPTYMPVNPSAALPLPCPDSRCAHLSHSIEVQQQRGTALKAVVARQAEWERVLVCQEVLGREQAGGGHATSACLGLQAPYKNIW